MAIAEGLIIIPAYNEAMNIGEVLRGIRKYQIGFHFLFRKAPELQALKWGDSQKITGN